MGTTTEPVKGKNKNLLHALLAVEADLKGRGDKISRETIHTFKQKQPHFSSSNRSYEPAKEEGRTFPSEDREMVTTVTDKLNYFQKQLIKTIDLVYQKDMTNPETEVDLEVGDIVFAEKVVATALLDLKKYFTVVREVYSAIPTLAPNKKWEKDPDTPNVYRAAPVIKQKEEKVPFPVTLAPATDKHPAQVDKEYRMEVVGTWTEIERTGAWSPAEKSEKLERIDMILEALQRARQEANTIKVKNVKIAKNLFDFINHGKVH